MTNGFVQPCMCVCVCARARACASAYVCARTHAQYRSESERSQINSRTLLQWNRTDAISGNSSRAAPSVGYVTVEWHVAGSIEYATVRSATTPQAVHNHTPARRSSVSCSADYVVIKSHVVLSIPHVDKFRQSICIFVMSVTLAELNSSWCRDCGVAECHDTAMT